MAALSLEDEGDRNDHPGGDGLARLFGRGEAPFAHCRQRGLVEPRVAARFGELQFLDRAFGADQHLDGDGALLARSEEHTSELQSLMRISYAVFCLKKKKEITADIRVT